MLWKVKLVLEGALIDPLIEYETFAGIRRDNYVLVEAHEPGQARDQVYAAALVKGESIWRERLRLGFARIVHLHGARVNTDVPMYPALAPAHSDCSKYEAGLRVVIVSKIRVRV